MSHFLTAPLDRGAEIRRSVRDADGHPNEVGQAPAGREAGRADGR